MQTEPDHASVGSAVGLAFVVIVMVSLFVSGALGVLATRSATKAKGAGPEPEQQTPAVASAHTAVLVKDQVVTRFRELMLLREIALRERNPSLLASVYADGAANLARDRAEIQRLRRQDRRLEGLHLPVKVVDAYRSGEDRWVVVARLGRSSAKLVTRSGRPVKGVAGRAADVYRCTLVERDGRWLLLRLALA